MSSGRWPHAKHSFMPNMSHALFTGGTFNQVNHHHEHLNAQVTVKSGRDRLLDAVAPAAVHNSGQRFDPPKCPDAHTAAIQKLMDWVLRGDPETRNVMIMWLSGAASVGKSAIAQTLAKLCASRGRLLASFFFGRADQTRNHAGALIPTIACQLCDILPSIRSHIITAIEEDPLIFKRSLANQFKSLVVQPLRPLFQSGFFEEPESPRLIIIDGLDECLDRTAQRKILDVFSEDLRDSGIPLVILISSRPEHDIRAVFNSLIVTGQGAGLILDNTHLPGNPDKERFLLRTPGTTGTDLLEHRFSITLENFQLANDIRGSDLHGHPTRLAKTANKDSDGPRNIQHVIEKMDDLESKLEEFHVLLAKSKLSAMLPSSGLARQQMPLKPGVFYGRDYLVRDIAQMLVEETTSRVCILGPGGMGKTSVSLAVVESPLVQKRFARKEPVWVPCIGATSAPTLIETLYVQLQISGDKQPTVGKIISELNSSTTPRLIIFDNFETPWNAPSETQQTVGDILRRLAQLKHIAMLVTMRGSHPPCDNSILWQARDIQPTDKEACFHIFHDIYPVSKADPGVARLLHSLGYMPFAITLMANLGKEAHWTAKHLLDAWLECGPDMLSENPEKSMTRSISLSVDSDLVRRNRNALLLLSVLSLLPAGTTSENLRWWAPTLKRPMIPAAISTLSKAALLVQNKQQGSSLPTLFVIPVVQSFMHHQGRISPELRKQIHSSCCQYVLEHACRYDLPEFHRKSKAMAAEDTNIHSVLFDSPAEATNLSDKTMEALIAFCWHRCDTKASLEIVEHVLQLAHTSGVKRHIAVTTWCLGKSCHQLAKYHLAYEHLLKAYRLFNSLNANDVELQEFACQCGTDLVDAARFIRPREEVVLLAQVVEGKCAALGNDLIHGRSLMFLALALQEAQRRREALPYAERAKNMLAAIGNVCHLANTLQVITRIHYYDNRISDALAVISVSWRLAELSDSAFFQAFISVDFGMVLYTLNRDAEAWKQIEIAHMKAVECGDEHSVALALDYMGYGYLRRGDYRNALKAYEAAVTKWAGTNEVKGEKHCKENLAMLKEKRRTPDAVVGFRRPGLDNDDSLFYPASQTSGVHTLPQPLYPRVRSHTQKLHRGSVREVWTYLHIPSLPAYQLCIAIAELYYADFK